MLLTSTACWAILFVLIKFMFEGTSLNMVETVTQFTTMVRDHNSYASKVYHSCNVSHFMPRHWSPPEDNWVKINVDAHVALDVDRGFGVVVRDSRGALLAAGVKRVYALWPLDISELAAVVYGIKLAIYWDTPTFILRETA